LNKLNTRDKFMWFLTKNMNRRVVDANRIKLQEVVVKSRPFVGNFFFKRNGFIFKFELYIYKSNKSRV